MCVKIKNQSPWIYLKVMAIFEKKICINANNLFESETEELMLLSNLWCFNLITLINVVKRGNNNNLIFICAALDFSHDLQYFMNCHGIDNTAS